MTSTIPLTITVEEAVAEMVNMDYIPAGHTLLDMMAAFQEEAEVDYENALAGQLAPFKIRLDSCKTRHTLAQHLLKSLQYEVDHPEGSMIVLADESFSFNV